MNVLLIQPQFKKSEKAYPLGLGYIGAVLKQKGHKVFGIDLSFSSLTDAYSIIEKEAISLIGVSLMSYNFKNILSLCRKIKRDTPIPIVAGGPHVTIFREKLLYDYNDCFDYLIIGEGEYTLSYFVECIEKKLPLDSVNNLIYFDNRDIVINKYCAEDNDLDCFPFPDRTIFPISRYKGMLTRYNDYTQIITSRGCNNRCRYCPELTLWGRWRGRSAKNILDEITSIIDTHGIREFHIEDANFFGGGVERINELSNQIINNKLNIAWQCPNGLPVTDFNDQSVLELMARAGCYNICLGIESFDDKVLRSLGRSSDFERVKDIIKVAHRVGMEVVGYFINGLPGQTLESIKNDIALSRKLNFDFIHYSIFHLIPGSTLYNQHARDLSPVEKLENKMFIPKANIKYLKRMRVLSCLMNCFKPRFLLYIFKNSIAFKNPFRFVRRAAVHLFGIDLKF